MGLSKSFNTLVILASSVAGIVGSGWLLGPLVCAKMVGPAAIMTWIIGGFLMMVVGATFVVLTCKNPIAGGTVRYFQLHYGHFAGFSFSWIAWLAWVAVPPIETMALIQYSASYIPHLMTTGPSPVLTPFGMIIAMSCMILITYINNFGVSLFSKINYLILTFKLAVPVITTLLLFSSQFHFAYFTDEGGFMPYGIKSIFAALPIAGVIYSFIGFNPAVELAAETKNPNKTIPIAILGSLSVCIVLYTLIQIAFIGALPENSLKQGWSSITFSGESGPFVGLLGILGFVWFVKALYVDAIISPFGTAMVQAMTTARLTYAMSENGYFPKSLMKINAHHSPNRAMLLNLIVGFLFFLPFPSWQHMVGFLVSCLVLGYIIGPLSLMLNAKSKVMHGFCLLAFYICNLMIFWTGWGTISKVLILFFSGYFLLAFKCYIKKEVSFVKNLDILRGSWVVFYMIGIGIISYLSSFDGRNIVPFGLDFLIVALLSVGIYMLAAFLVNYTALNYKINEGVPEKIPGMMQVE